MKTVHCLALLTAFVSLLVIAPGSQAKTVFRRTDKISENFKQLAPEEIDPNVAPPEPQKVETLDPEDVITAVGTALPETAETEEVAPAAAATVLAEATNELIVDESLNEIPSAETPAVAPAANAVTSAPAASTATAVAAKPTKLPAKPEDDDKNPINRYCKCSESSCDCCRKFGLPLIPSGPGCARISYLGNDEMSVSLKYGDFTLASRRISSKRARPICVGLPGGYSKFCGRVYGLSRAKENFKACLAFELRADDEVEAALRVSCFKFGPEGLRVAEAEPLPTEVNKEEDDDDDDDIFGFAAGGGDDDEDEDDDYDADDAEEPDEDDDAETDTDDYADDPEAPEEADYGGFSLGGLLDELEDDDEEKPSKKPATAAAITPVVAAAADQTREHVELPQSKDEAGSVSATAEETAAATVAEAANSAVEEAAVSAVTAAPAANAADAATPVKSKKSKKTKKNKKKKAASATEDGFAYELLNGILDFFN